MTADRTYSAMVGSQAVELPLVPLSDDLTIALLICVDHGVAFAEAAGRELADLMRPAAPDIVVSVATMGIPLAIEASRALGLDDYVILHKTPKIHLGETWSEPVVSITTDKPQRLRMDPARGGGRRHHLHRRIHTRRPPAGPAHRGRSCGDRDAHDRGRGLAGRAGRGRRQGPRARVDAPVPPRRSRE